MDAIETIMTRTSVPPKLLTEPGPDDAQIEALLAAAVRAPDHGAIQPWRFHVVRGASRARLGEIFVEALIKRDPAAPADAVEKERLRPSYAPVAIVVCAEISDANPNVPPVEQIVATGAAMQNILNAAHAAGFGAFISTGKNARDPLVKRAFGLADKDEIVGFVYVGTPRTPQSVKPRPDPKTFTREWTGLATVAE
jgi:nitroreductase